MHCRSLQWLRSWRSEPSAGSCAGSDQVDWVLYWPMPRPPPFPDRGERAIQSRTIVEYLCIFLGALFSIAAIGHGIWVLWRRHCPRPVRRVGDRPRGRPRRGVPALCAAEASVANGMRMVRPSARRPRRRPVGRPGRQPSAAQTFARFVVLASDAYRLLSTAFKQRHDELLAKPGLKPRLAVAEEALLTVLAADEPAPASLLGGALDGVPQRERAGAVDRDRALSWDPACSEADLAALSLGIQRSLARLLKLSGLIPEALRLSSRPRPRPR